MLALLLSTLLALPAASSAPGWLPAQEPTPAPVPSPDPAPPPADDPAEGSPEQADPAPEPTGPLPLTEAQTLVRVRQYARGEHWALRGLVLLSLGPSWHPGASATVLDALTSKDERLRAYALETLARTEAEALRAVMTTELVEALVKKVLRERGSHWHDRAQVVLEKTFPTATAKERADWDRHWYALDRTYVPEPWKEPKLELSGRSVALPAVDRALDLYEAGLDVVICMDSTGSMQVTIDATAAAIDDLVVLLTSIAPKTRLGLVHYRDFGDMNGGAEVLEKLEKRIEKVRDRLARLQAGGGGDFPERVERGLSLALDPKEMRWKPDTNKLVVIVGDAPPHDETLDQAIALAKEAYERPFGKPATVVRARERDGRSSSAPTRPFVTAAIGVGQSSVTAATRDAFVKIAEAGGGAYGEVLTEGKSDASDQIVAHVLKLSFGAQYEEQLDAFARIFLEYHRLGLFD